MGLSIETRPATDGYRPCLCFSLPSRFCYRRHNYDKSPIHASPAAKKRTLTLRNICLIPQRRHSEGVTTSANDNRCSGPPPPQHSASDHSRLVPDPCDGGCPSDVTLRCGVGIGSRSWPKTGAREPRTIEAGTGVWGRMQWCTVVGNDAGS